MPRILLALTAIGMLFSAIPAKADYYHHHHRYHHREWRHHHWHYW
jgi:hypothetical protein